MNDWFELSDYSPGTGAAIFFISDGNRNIQTTTLNSGICNIEYIDTQNNIISGTFEFQIFDEQTQTLYQVTDGRFDSTFTR
ncbi:hypothetical protein [Nonlabens sp. Asnod2-A12]|uniref:hypothetical protein n=1 Tax=Nonlabens sp. Asnod2-A12 TaxID=3160578 RepID=UPI003868E891